jgi:two-component system, chemotaxis family, sensor kinase Cph1
MDRAPRIVYEQGDHVCTLFSSREEQVNAAIDYIRGGLSRGERCLYICGEQTPHEFRAELRAAGIDADAEDKRGALVLSTKREHLKGGSFKASRMIEMLAGAVADALKAGFAGLCAAGDMTWLLDEAPGSREIVEYEALLNHFYASNQALGLCQYNRNRLPANIVDACLATHRHIRVAGHVLLENPYYELPEDAMTIPRNGEGVEDKIAQLGMTAAQG